MLFLLVSKSQSVKLRIPSRRRMVIVFIKTNIQSQMINITITIVCRRTSRKELGVPVRRTVKANRKRQNLRHLLL